MSSFVCFELLVSQGGRISVLAFVITGGTRIASEKRALIQGTPATSLFERSRRDFSHGCVRIADPVGLAAWLLKDQPQWTREQIAAAMQGKPNLRVNLTQAVPVLLYYVTAMVSPEDGRLQFAADIYGHDAKLARALAALRDE